ncbi:septum formation family protein [Nitriliruptor alkaliphilus]|uniref:septum formation family protein n=1 Tax=Nitriliruptor alkaliphilus TaxID=427918 RepID=UPI000696DF5A|nr:septum formation family protein [Nitriliruptor alkaliphilus]
MIRAATVVLALLAVLASGCVARGGFALEPGDCVRTDEAGAGPGGLTDVTIVDCDEPHHLEVFHVFDLAPDQTEGEALVDAVREACLGDAFTDYVGVPEDESPLELLPLPPTADQLARGDTEVVCTLREPGGGTRTAPLRADAHALGVPS